MTEQQLRELEWAAAYLLSRRPPRCRCGGTCGGCQAWAAAQARVRPEVVLELVREVRLARGSS